MTWHSTFPLGTVSVKANRPIGQDNTTYIETTMGNSIIGTNGVTTRDHFWNVGANEDGRHRWIQSPAFTVGGLPADANIGTAMDGVLWYKLLSSTVSTAQQDVQPFYRNVKQIMQLLCIRAMGVFNGSEDTPEQAHVVYSHNLAAQPAGIVRTGTGRYTVTFANALPSNNYLVLGGAIRNDSSLGTELLFEMQAAVSLNTVKSTTAFRFMTRSDGGTGHDPLQAWFVCFGG